jgi:hypothetical protein
MLLSLNLGTLTSWNPPGHSRPVTGLLYLLLAPYASLIGETHLSCEQLPPFAGTLGGASVLHLVILLASWMVGHVG